MTLGTGLHMGVALGLGPKSLSTENTKTNICNAYVYNVCLYAQINVLEG